MKLFILFTAALFAPVAVFAHPGGLNDSGCHYCRTNCEEKWGIPTNDYHCHAGGDTSVYTDSAPSEPTPEAELIEPISAPAPESNPEPVSEPISEPTPEVTMGTISEPTQTSPVENAPEEPQEKVEIENDVHPPEDTSPEDTNDAPATLEEAEDATTGELVLGFATLAAMGYGGYRGVKAIVKRVKK
ncbi:MAG: hypothetical protein Q8P30_00265 [Candidatus Uhrbacteria bacterium]|nr:hypothetical protein [Candidatus Uhrbacteria bacterium]